MNKKALIAMSGGVDSSVAALLTKNAGYDCLGAKMTTLEYQRNTPVVLQMMLKMPTMWQGHQTYLSMYSTTLKDLKSLLWIVL